MRFLGSPVRFVCYKGSTLCIQTGQEGFEPPTPGFGVRCSTNSSYWPVVLPPLHMAHLHISSSGLCPTGQPNGSHGAAYVGDKTDNIFETQSDLRRTSAYFWWSYSFAAGSFRHTPKITISRITGSHLRHLHVISTTKFGDPVTATQTHQVCW